MRRAFKTFGVLEHHYSSLVGRSTRILCLVAQVKIALTFGIARGLILLLIPDRKLSMGSDGMGISTFSEGNTDVSPHMTDSMCERNESNRNGEFNRQKKIYNSLDCTAQSASTDLNPMAVLLTMFFRIQRTVITRHTPFVFSLTNRSNMMMVSNAAFDHNVCL